MDKEKYQAQYGENSRIIARWFKPPERVKKPVHSFAWLLNKRFKVPVYPNNSYEPLVVHSYRISEDDRVRVKRHRQAKKVS